MRLFGTQNPDFFGGTPVAGAAAEVLELATPAARYAPSARPFPETIEPLRQTRGGRSAGARVPPVDYRDELRQRQPVHHVPEHPSTISPAFTRCGRGALG